MANDMEDSGEISENIELKTLIKKRGLVKAKVTRFQTFLREDSKRDVMVVETRLKLFEPVWQEFENIQGQIELIDTKEDSERETFEIQYTQVVADAKHHIIRNTATSSNGSNQPSFNQIPNNASNINLQVKLPTLKLPTFHGQYQEWISFHDTFDSLIHKNINLPNIQKFHYLKSCLHGEAAHVIASLGVSDSNYVVAWQMLKERFQNKRLIIKNHITSLFNLPNITKESATSLRQLLDKTNTNLRALKALGMPIESWDIIIIYLLTTKFDYSTNKEWELLIPSAELPTMKEMTDFLNHRCQMLESVNAKVNITKVNQNTNDFDRNTNKFWSSKQNVRASSHAMGTNYQPHCQICNQSHNIYQCPEFLNLSPEARFDEIKKLRLCSNCLRANHQVAQCQSKFKCNKCKQKHNSLLHFGNAEQNQNTPPVAVSEPVPSTSNQITNHWYDNQTISQVLLSTAMVNIPDQSGTIHECRAFLDAGSQLNFISENMCKQLNLEVQSTNISVSGIMQNTNRVKHFANITIKSRYNNYNAHIKCLIIPKLTGNIPSTTFSIKQLNIPSNLELADPSFNVSQPVDLLIGAELFWELLHKGQIRLAKHQPYMQRTHLGWVVGGRFNQSEQSQQISCHMSLQEIDQHLLKFWEIEEYQNTKNYTKEESDCEIHFQGNHYRNSEGRFIVNLPFKSNAQPLGHSKEYALKRLVSLESKLNKNPKLRHEYAKFMNEYLNLGHMELIPENKSNVESKNTFYLPHHAVIKESSLTTKVRVVFDGSAKSSTGVSLNDNLIAGPTIQQELVSILARFRTHNFVFVADITKMYRQILVNENDRDYQRILWREDPSEPIKSYRLCTVTYGTTSAPFLAIRCLHELANNEKLEHPLAHEIITRDFYVDDVLTGSNTLQETIAIRDELVEVLAKGGFELTKFASNHPKLTFNQDHSKTMNLNQDLSMKTLGLIWNYNLDVFQYSVTINSSISKITKRVILATVAQIYDPLGLVSPLLIKAKILIQKLWLLKLGWDDSVPLNIHNSWSSFVEQLPLLNEVQFPRKVISDNIPNKIEIHGFCDASELAYGACVYIRTTDLHGKHVVHLLCAKSRVAPLKTISLPRLELCGAVLLARLVNKTMQTINLDIKDHYYWTDSKIVLAWLSKSKRWKTFVANRVSEVLSLTEEHQWRHVSTHDNPADIVSRGMSPAQLKESSLWFNGPKWLTDDYENWPNISNQINITEIPDQRTTHSYAVSIIPERFNILTKYSDFSKLIRVVAYCLRFLHNCKNTNKFTGYLTCVELNESKTLVIKSIQLESFATEIRDLKRNNHLSRKSKLLSLNPFLDKDGVLRVGGRLRHAQLHYNHKHPIILPHHHVTQLIIRQEHIYQLHAGPNATLANLRLRYWPIAGRSLTRQVIHKCIKCFRAKPVGIDQMMGDLPKHRVEPARPFLNCGIDYAGPISLKDGHGRTKKIIKSYIALFVCFATKAIHIELVCDLTSESFLNALKRFMSRRGKVSHIYSDNATTFVGANRELNNIHEFLLSETFNLSVINSLSHDNITWHFIPPRAPNFGGLWESGIKAVKIHLKRVIGEALLNYDEMYTLLTQIEACLNSRPLCPLSDNPEDLEILTPAHFLIGDILTLPVEPDVTTTSKNRLSRWQHIQQLSQHFWKRWQIEYLAQLHPRNKWQQEKKIPLKHGQLMIIKDDSLPPLRWSLGRIVELHPGPDEIVRVVSLKTKSGIVKRSISKLCVLPIS